MELPPKLTNDHDIVAQIADLTDVYNSLIDYLESQKEGEEPFIQHGGHLYDKTGNEECCEACKKPIYINNNRVTLH